jgi:hypothetical protein
VFHQDRTRLYNETLKFDELKRFIKAYAWVIIPVYDNMGEDLRAELSDIIYALRTYGFNAAEDVVIKQLRGSEVPKPLGGINNVDRRAQVYHDILLAVEHDIEKTEEANELEILEFRVGSILNQIF